MGQYKKMLLEGMDLSKIVGKIKDDVLKFRLAQEKDEALFRKELDRVEDHAKKALSDIAKVLDKHQVTLEALFDSKWDGSANERLRECVGTMNQMGTAVKEVLSEQDASPVDAAPEEPETAESDDEAADVADPEVEN